MADFIARLGSTIDVPPKKDYVVERMFEVPTGGLILWGRANTYCLIRKSDDAIASIGFLNRLEGDSVRQTLAEILTSFEEAQIPELKKKLVGQYVLLVKKNSSLFIFCDIMGARNIFCSDDGAVASSSFSQVEGLVGTGSGDLEMQKVLEYLAMRHVLYPTWIGGSTAHKRIRWLLPYEYLVIDLASCRSKICSTTWSFQNRKETNRSLLSGELLASLSSIVKQQEFQDSLVGATLTGGHDSRLVAAVAAKNYRAVHFRIAVSAENPRSLIDREVAARVSRVRGIPLDVYQFKPGRDEERFREQTEWFSPFYNHTMAPLIDAAGAYSLGFGGAFGTELFMPIQWNSIDEYIGERLRLCKQALVAGEEFWAAFYASLREQFEDIKKHYHLSEPDDRDYIRLFCLLVTARYGSFILAAFNGFGYQLDPYGSYSVLELAMRISPALWGDHRKFSGNGLVQKAVMDSLDPRMGRVLTYMHARPMLSLSVSTFPLYAIGFIIQAARWFRSRSENAAKGMKRTILPGAQYISDGWESGFLARMGEKYDLSSSPLVPAAQTSVQ